MIEQTNITAADVAQAVEGSPFHTNASKIRATLGRGSLATIQRHLETMRAQQRIAAAQPLVAAAAPKAPAEVVDSLWLAAFHAAQAQTLLRLESLSSERDGLAAQAVAQSAYVEELLTAVDALEAAAAAAVAAQAQAAAAQAAAVAAAQAETAAALAGMAEQSAALTTAQAATVAAKQEAANAAAIAIRDAQIQRLEQQMMIDRLNEQLTETKALHWATRNPQN